MVSERVLERDVIPHARSVVAVVCPRSPERVLETAIAAAEQGRGRLTVVIERRPNWALLSGVSAGAIAADVERSADELQRLLAADVLARVPDCLPLTTIRCCGVAQQTLGRLLASGLHDLLVTRGRRHAKRARRHDVPALVVC